MIPEQGCADYPLVEIIVSINMDEMCIMMSCCKSHPLHICSQYDAASIKRTAFVLQCYDVHLIWFLYIAADRRNAAERDRS